MTPPKLDPATLRWVADSYEAASKKLFRRASRHARVGLELAARYACDMAEENQREAARWRRAAARAARRRKERT